MLGYSYKAIFPVVFVLCLISAAGAVANVDVRILIDVSGSMKANDVQNLRIPAVRLVAELMPMGAKAGIWTFSVRVEELILADTVDREWKAAAIAAASRIHSRGQFTDVEAALNKATKDWAATGEAEPGRHVILLTDGMVDVSKQAADSAASLQRVFLHMFEQAASPDSIPLLDNRFEVDSSISEMTLLVFRGEAANSLQLVSPGGIAFDEGSLPGNIKRPRSGFGQ